MCLTVTAACFTLGQAYRIIRMTPKWLGRLIYFKVLVEFLALIFFAIACGLTFTSYLTMSKLKNDFDGIFHWERGVLLAAAIIYAIMFIITFLACSYTVHLTSDYFDKDDEFFLQLKKLLGLDKEILPLPSPFDEKSEKDSIESPFLEEIVDETSQKDGSENAYLVPIVEVKGDEADYPDHEEPKGMFTFTYQEGKSLPEKMKYSDTFVSKIIEQDTLALEMIILDENSYPTIFDYYVKPSKIDKSQREVLKKGENFGKNISKLEKSENLGAGKEMTKEGTEKLMYKESMVSKIPSNVALDQLIIGTIEHIEKTLDM